MDYATWNQMQPNYLTDPNPQLHQNPNYPNPQIHQNPNYPNPQIHQNPNYATDPNAQNHYFYQNYYYPQSINPNPSVDHHNFYQDPNFIQPVFDPYNSAAQYTVSHEYSYQQSVNVQLESSSSYYQNPAGFLANEHVAVNQYAFNTNSMGVNMGTYQTNQPQNRGKWKKAPKKTTVVQSAWCDICHIKCDTSDVLELHKQGKKHKKNLQKNLVKSKKAAATVPTTPSLASAPVPVTVGTHTPTTAPISASASGVLVAYTASVVPMIGPQEDPNKASKKKKRPKPGESLEKLETKKKKVLEGGAAAEAVLTCSVCNVVCNSDTVYSYHLAGQKHATMMKKHAMITTVATAI